MTDAVQTLLGHHALKGMTMYAYMRDKLAAPLREYEHMLSAVRKCLFIPDATRSGLFRSEAAQLPEHSESWSLVRGEHQSDPDGGRG